MLFKELDEESALTTSGESSSSLTAFDSRVLLPQATPNGTTAKKQQAMRQGSFDEEALKSQFRSLPHQQRVRLISILVSAAEPADLAVLSRVLDRQLRLSKDIISTMPDRIITSIFEKLEVQEVSGQETR